MNSKYSSRFIAEQTKVLRDYIKEQSIKTGIYNRNEFAFEWIAEHAKQFRHDFIIRVRNEIMNEADSNLKELDKLKEASD